jgi:hypothetical protein
MKDRSILLRPVIANARRRRLGMRLKPVTGNRGSISHKEDTGSGVHSTARPTLNRSLAAARKSVAGTEKVELQLALDLYQAVTERLTLQNQKIDELQSLVGRLLVTGLGG